MEVTGKIYLKKLNSDRIQKSKIIAVMNHKGGCGKTALTDALAHFLMMNGHNVLVIDNDPQCNITQRLGIVSLNDVVENRVDQFYKDLDKPIVSNNRARSLPVEIQLPQRYAQKTEGKLCLIAGSGSAEEHASSAYKNMGAHQSAKALAKIIADYKQYYDYIIIDTAPSIHDNAINELTVNVADVIIVPFDGNEAMFGLNAFVNFVKRILIAETPKMIFAMTKYQRDTVDLKYFSPIPYYHNETTCFVYRIMKSIFPKNICDHGIPERKMLRNHSYVGLLSKYASRKLYDDMYRDILNIINSTTVDIVNEWEKSGLNSQFNKLIEEIESRRANDIIRAVNQVYFED